MILCKRTSLLNITVALAGPGFITSRFATHQASPANKSYRKPTRDYSLELIAKTGDTVDRQLITGTLTAADIDYAGEIFWSASDPNGKQWLGSFRDRRCLAKKGESSGKSINMGTNKIPITKESGYGLFASKGGHFAYIVGFEPTWAGSLLYADNKLLYFTGKQIAKNWKVNFTVECHGFTKDGEPIAVLGDMDGASFGPVAGDHFYGLNETPPMESRTRKPIGLIKEVELLKRVNKIVLSLISGPRLNSPSPEQSITTVLKDANGRGQFPIEVTVRINSGSPINLLFRVSPDDLTTTVPVPFSKVLTQQFKVDAGIPLKPLEWQVS